MFGRFSALLTHTACERLKPLFSATLASTWNRVTLKMDLVLSPETSKHTWRIYHMAQKATRSREVSSQDKVALPETSEHSSTTWRRKPQEAIKWVARIKLHDPKRRNTHLPHGAESHKEPSSESPGYSCTTRNVGTLIYHMAQKATRSHQVSSQDKVAQPETSEHSFTTWRRKPQEAIKWVARI